MAQCHHVRASSISRYDLYLVIAPCRTGHTRLMKAVRNMGLRTRKGRTTALECQVRFVSDTACSTKSVSHITARDQASDIIPPSG